MSDINLLRRFLCLGLGSEYSNKKPVLEIEWKKKKKEKDTYNINEYDLGMENAAVPVVMRLIDDGKGEQVIKEIISFSVEGRAAKQEPILFALAICSKLPSDNFVNVRNAANKAICQICRIPTHLFQYVNYCEHLAKKTGWCRAQRAAVQKWYNDKTPLELAYYVTRYRSRSGWSHKDVVKLAHVKPQQNATSVVLRYTVHGLTKAKEMYKDKEEAGLQELLEYFEAVETLKQTKDEQLAARLIEQHKFVWEHVPTWLLNSKEVWRALLHDIPMLTLIQRLGKLTSLKLLEPDSPDTARVVDKLQDEKLLSSARIHPFTLHVASKQYAQGKSRHDKVKWTATPAITKALDAAFLNAFQIVEPTGKRFILAIDASTSMTHGGVNGSPQVTPLETAAAMAMVTLHKEQTCRMVTFSQTVYELSLTPEMSVKEIHDDMVKKMAHTGPVKACLKDCAQPILWALKEKIATDVFIIYTDSETNLSAVSPDEAIWKYRQQMGLPRTKFIVCGLTSNALTLANPDDTHMLDIVGFDSSVPDIIRSFVMDEL